MTILLNCFIIACFHLACSYGESIGVYDISEVRSVTYDPTITEKYLWFDPELDTKKVTWNNIDDYERRIIDKSPKENDSAFQFITNSNGQKFACSLPNIVRKKETTANSSRNPKYFADVIAASFYVNRCIYKIQVNRWWQYEFCKGTTIEQFHGEPGEPGFVKNILGIFNGSYTMPQQRESTEDRLLYVEEWYNAGSFCEVGNKKVARSTGVRYECDPQLSSNEAYIHSVEEPTPCEYIVRIKVGTLCNYPEFVQPSQNNRHSIKCNPYLEENQVRSFLEEFIKEKEEEERVKMDVIKAKRRMKQTTRRYSAMTKGARRLNEKDKIKKVNAEMDYQGDHFDYLVTLAKEEKEALEIVQSDAYWDIIKTGDATDYLFYIDYDNVYDENRGNLWYYFNDPTWPKDAFPNELISVGVHNQYVLDIVDLYMSSSASIIDMYDHKFHDKEIRRLETGGPFDVSKNLAIHASEIQKMFFIDMTRRSSMEWEKILTLWLAEDYNIHGIIKNINETSLPDEWKAANHFVAYDIVETMYKEMEKTMPNIQKIGKDAEEWPYTLFYSVLDVQPWPENERNSTTPNFKMSINTTQATIILYDFYKFYLTPFYFYLSTKSFQMVTPGYFHVAPPNSFYLWDEDDELCNFHLNLINDFKETALFAAAASVLKLHSEIVRLEGPTSLKSLKLSPKKAGELWPKIRNKVLKKCIADEGDEHEEIVHQIFFETEDGKVAKIRKELWEERVAEYKREFLGTDKAKRVEARSIHKHMINLLDPKNENSQFSILGEKIDKILDDVKKAPQIFNDITEKLQEMLNDKKLDFTNFEELLSKLEEDDSSLLSSGKQSMKIESTDDIRKMYEMLDKAGLGKDSVKVHFYDENGKPLDKDELTGFTKNLFEEMDDKLKISNVEKAYNTKALTKKEKKQEKKE